MFEYETQGVCPESVSFDIAGGKLKGVKFDGGCNGNLKAVGKLVEGMDCVECVQKLKGIRCGFKDTSCADQLAKAIELAMKDKEKQKVLC